MKSRDLIRPFIYGIEFITYSIKVYVLLPWPIPPNQLYPILSFKLTSYLHSNNHKRKLSVCWLDDNTWQPLMLITWLMSVWGRHGTKIYLLSDTRWSMLLWKGNLSFYGFSMNYHDLNQTKLTEIWIRLIYKYNICSIYIFIQFIQILKYISRGNDY